MSLFKRALGAVGAAGAAVTNKYIDEQLAQQRAEFMANLQRTTAGNIRQDDAAFRDQRAPIERENARQDILTRGAATRESETAAMNDPLYQGARRATADADADAEIQRKLRAGEALLPFEQKRAEALARTEAKFRQPAGGGKQSMTDKIAEMEAAIGRKLTQQEREAIAGLGSKPANDPTKQALDAVLDKYKASGSEMTPDAVGQELSAIVRSLRVAPMEQAIQAGLQRARSEGKEAEAIAELRQAGFSDQQLIAAGVTQDQLKAAAAPAPQRGSLFNRARGADLETTETPDGRTVYRMRGTTQWYPSEREARDKAAPKPEPRQPAQDMGGLIPGV